MTQVASLLAVATVFIGLWTRNIYILLLGRRDLHVRQKTTYAEAWAKNAAGVAYARGGA